MRILLIVVLALSVSCGCSAVVIDALPDGGMSPEYCADECATSADCASGWHCSWHPKDPKGICFKNP